MCLTTGLVVYVTNHLVAFNCGQLGLAILRGDLSTVSRIIHQSPKYLLDRNYLGQTLAHLAILQPKCLGLVLEAQPDLIDETDVFGWTAFHYATSVCCILCDNPSPSYEVNSECQCAEAVEILLQAQCRIILLAYDDDDDTDDSPIWRYPLSVKIMHLLASALKERMLQLRDLAFREPDRETLLQLGIGTNIMPDAWTAEILSAPTLMGKKIGRSITGNDRDSTPRYWASVYHNPFLEPWQADIFWNEGFTDVNSVDSIGRSPLRMLSNSFVTYENISYVTWLVDHGADTLEMDQHFDDRVGFRILAQGISSRFTLEEQNYILLVKKLAPWATGDSCVCYCSEQGCLPIKQLLRGSIRYTHEKVYDISEAIQAFTRIENIYSACSTSAGGQEDVDMAVIRLLVFDLLELKHTCCIRERRPQRGHESFDDDILNIQQEQHDDLERLEELVTDFRVDLQHSRLPLREYLETRWAERMQLVLEELENAKMSTEERRAAEEVGVVWGPSIPPRTPSPESEPDHSLWYFEEVDRILDCNETRNNRANQSISVVWYREETQRVLYRA
jgi:hypothetical protein